MFSEYFWSPKRIKHVLFDFYCIWKTCWVVNFCLTLFWQLAAVVLQTITTQLCFNYYFIVCISVFYPSVTVLVVCYLTRWWQNIFIFCRQWNKVSNPLFYCTKHFCSNEYLELSAKYIWSMYYAALWSLLVL